MVNYLDTTVARQLSACNFNYHSKALHPDRVMLEHDLIYILEGEWEIYQDGIPFTIQKDDVILLQANHHHYGLTQSAPQVRTIFLHFSASENDTLSPCPGLISPQEEPFQFSTVTNCRGNINVKYLFENIIYAFWSDDKYKKANTSAMLAILLCQLSSMRSDGPTQNSESINRILYLIKTTPDKVFTIDELAQTVQQSAKTVATNFKKITGSSIHEYQMNLKLQMARSLLQHEPATQLKELAQAFGFYDEYHFSKRYKKKFGYSPKRHTYRTSALAAVDLDFGIKDDTK
jgi:AraC-like DNA-binding protein